MKKFKIWDSVTNWRLRREFKISPQQPVAESANIKKKITGSSEKFRSNSQWFFFRKIKFSFEVP